MFQPNATSTKSAAASIFVRPGRLCVLLFLALLPSWQARAQTGGAAPPNNAAGRPAGSYQLSGFDNVNLFNGNLNFSLPLLQVGGRGGAQVPVALSIDSTRWKLGRDGGIEKQSATLNLRPENEINATAVVTDSLTYELWFGTDEFQVLTGTYDASQEVIIDRLGGGLISGGGALTQSRFFILDPDGWQGAEAGYGPGVLQGRVAFRRSGQNNQVTSRLTRVVFTAPDGTELELRDRATYGRPFLTGQTNPPRGKVFVSADGTAATFITDEATTDDPVAMGAAPAGDEEENLWLFKPDGFLLFADGTRYRIDDGLVSWIRDRNGNLVTFVYDAGGRVITITDSLGRVVTVSYHDRQDPADPSKTARDYDQISFAGFQGQPRSIVVRHRKLSETGVLRADFPAGDSHRTRGKLFPQYEQGAGGSLVFDADVVTTVELPDGRVYRLLYNHHGEVARVVVPTGGAIEYDYRADYSSVSVQRALWRRRVYEGGGGATQSGDVGAPTLTQTYKSERTGSVAAPPYRTAVTAEQWQGPDGKGGTLLTRERHHFRGWANSVQAGFYPPAMDGREEKAETLATSGDADTATVLRSVSYDWRQRPAEPGSQEGWNNNIPRDLRMVETVMTLENGLSSKTTSVDPGSSTGEVAFDRYNNQTRLWEYDYKAAGESWRLLRHTRTKYVDTLSVGGTTYDYACDPATTCKEPASAAGLIHIRRLPEYTEVVDGVTGAVASRSEFLYDELTYSEDDYGVLSVTFPGWTSSETTARGNPTTMRAWLNSLGAHDNSQAYLQTHVRYDRFGNVTKSWDARGGTSEVEFSAEYKYALPTTVRSADPDGTGPLTPLVTTSVYDLATGLVTEATDANDRTTYLDYETGPGKLDRLKKVRRPDGGWTAYEYGDQENNLFLHTKTLRESGPTEKVLEGYQFFDGLGRATRSTTRTGEAAWVATAAEYDALGRVVGGTNPYETSEYTGLAPLSALWTTTRYDALGRPWEVESPDGAKVVTRFDGDRTLVTDQADKQRLSKVNALGRLTEVWEVRAQDVSSGTEGVTFPEVADVSAGYKTSYTYDVLGNLRRVDQGAQRRYFLYDSLGRLVRAKNPEQGEMAADDDFPAMTDPAYGNPDGDWSAGYRYDAAGNLAKRKDGRGVTASYTYDALNRNTLVHYDDAVLGAANHTPDVTRSYDGAALGRGRPWKTETAGVGRMTVEEYDAGGRPLRQIQRFWSGGAWSTASYGAGYAYDLAGNVKKLTYPSGHEVNYTYDAAGRLSGFAGELGDDVERTYADQMSYSEFGGLRQERFGTATPLYHKLHYNRRGQLFDIRLSTVAWSVDQWDWDRGAVVNYYSGNYAWEGNPAAPAGVDNNGNLRRQRHWVPASDQTSSPTFTQQTYEYDALNRLSWVAEAAGVNETVGPDSFRQAYEYDRWGNRTINAQDTQVYGQNPGYTIPEPQFAVAAATNRLVVPAGQPGRMDYDAAGNLINDSYSPQSSGSPAGLQTRLYDAENRMRSAADQGGGTTSYAYDGDGRRVKRFVGTSGEVWQVYGLGGVLLAEYAKESPETQPRKEYGYRGGELLVTAEPGSAGWGPAPAFTGPDPLSNGDTIKLEHLTDLRSAVNQLRQRAGLSPYNFTSDPNPERNVTAVKAEHIRQLRAALEEVRSRLNLSIGGYEHPMLTNNASPIYAKDFQELRDQIRDAWRADSVGADIRWLVTDQLGTPRMVVDPTGSLAGVTRHDYLPFGEELLAGTGGRADTQGYGTAGSVRQQFTGYERDDETKLDFAQARYFASGQGRFTSPDPYNVVWDIQALPSLEKAKATLDAYLIDPQQWNRYAYAINNPFRYVDPSGESIVLTGTAEQQRDGLKRVEAMFGKERMRHIVIHEGKEIPGLGKVMELTFLNEKHRAVFEAIGDNAEEREFSQIMGEIVGSDKITEYQLAKSFKTRVPGLLWGESIVTKTTAFYGGGATLNTYESMTGNVQIFVHPNGHEIAWERLRPYKQLKSSDGKELDFTREQVDSHEFGHAYNSIKFGGKVEVYKWALRMENIMRARQRSPNRRTGH